MSLSNLLARVEGRCQRSLSRWFFRSPVVIRNSVPYISFTFDDFPRSALLTGGSILKRYGLTGTYYASLGLMGKQAPTGAIFLPEDLKEFLAQGHELGCHTYAHFDSWSTKPQQFEASIIANQRALSALAPAMCFRTFSYPITPPWPPTKRRVAKHYVCSRGGGQRFNIGSTDLNNLAAYFLEQARGDRAPVVDLIERNRQDRGWLIFATHDVCDSHTPYGCTPAFFEDIVKCAVASGASILPVAQAWEAIRPSSQ